MAKLHQRRISEIFKFAFMVFPARKPYNLTAFAELLFGNSEKFSLEHRFLNGSLILGGLTALSSMVFNIALHLGIYLQLLTAGTAVLLFGLYYFSRIPVVQGSSW